MKSTIELYDLQLDVDIGTYAEGDIVPDRHLLDLTLSIDPSLVLIEKDEKALIFDYDPLVERIMVLAHERHYETQEQLLTLVVKLCAEYEEIRQMTLFLRKDPVANLSGALGIRLVINEDDLTEFRARS